MSEVQRMIHFIYHFFHCIKLLVSFVCLIVLYSYHAIADFHCPSVFFEFRLENKMVHIKPFWPIPHLNLFIETKYLLEDKAKELLIDLTSRKSIKFRKLRTCKTIKFYGKININAFTSSKLVPTTI